MRRLALIVLAVAALPAVAAAQTWGQPRYGASPAPYGQPYGGPVSHGYQGQAYGYSGSGFGDPRTYRPPVRHGYGYGYGYRYGRGHDRGARHRGSEWTRWSSPPGHGYHDVYGYNDDRAPRGTYLYDH